MAQLVRFCPKIRRLDPSDYPNEKWRRPLIKQKYIRAGLVQQQYGTHKNTSSDRCAASHKHKPER